MQHPKRADAAVVNQAVTLSRTPPVIDRPTPALGQHNNEILAELGYDAAGIADLRERKVI
jgi:crotonobetainyl-CoA:carnitine CoA-transferase CaiB-like acyl-CoA transferase